MLIRVFILAAFFFALGPSAALAQNQSVTPQPNASVEKWMSVEEFRSLATELAPKVNLFRDAWAQNPAAEFFGGTTRDYLYWLKGQLREVQTRGEFESKVNHLRALRMIDIRDFIIGESDVDIVTGRGTIQMDAITYGVSKIDYIDSRRFDANTVEGQNEIKQGYLPVEKIRLGSRGFIPWPGFGDGIAEIFNGRPTLVGPDSKEFSETYYAQIKLNHPILLVLRYVRLLAVNYFNSHGKDYPSEDLYDIDPPSAVAAQAIINQTLSTSDFASYLKTKKFTEWLNRTTHKAFRAYTNPTAALLLFKRFRLDELVAKYGNAIDPIYQYLFIKERKSNGLIRERLAQYGMDEGEFFVNPHELFPDMTLYHGTKDESSFRSILLQGILPSQRGVFGEGLYAVALKDVNFAKDWKKTPDLVVKFKVSERAQVVDVTKGAARKVYEAYGKSPEEFADFFGVDIIKYPFYVDAYVVKNSSALERPSGLTRQILTFGKFLEKTDKVETVEELAQIVESAALSVFTTAEIEEGFSQVKKPRLKAKIDLFQSIWQGATGLTAEMRLAALQSYLLFEQLKILMLKSEDKQTKRAIKLYQKKAVESLDDLIKRMGRTSKYKADEAIPTIKLLAQVFTAASVSKSQDEMAQRLAKTTAAKQPLFLSSVLHGWMTLGPFGMTWSVIFALQETVQIAATGHGGSITGSATGLALIMTVASMVTWSEMTSEHFQIAFSKNPFFWKLARALKSELKVAQKVRCANSMERLE